VEEKILKTTGVVAIAATTIAIVVVLARES
jgi:hypothetical protein